MIALSELEPSQWKLRRLLYEDGEWFCFLSRQPNLPVGFDESVEARHEILPLALLTAFLEAQRYATADGTAGPVHEELRGLQSYAVCCDNFF